MGWMLLRGNGRMLYHITLRIVHSSLFVSLCERTYLLCVVKEKYASCMREDLLLYNV